MSTSDDHVVMNTFTDLYTVERSLYRIYEFELPRPISLPQLAAFLVGLPVVVALWHFLHVSFTADRFYLWVGPPALAAWAINRPLAEGRRPLAWLRTQVRHRCEPAALDRLQRRTEPERMQVLGYIQEPMVRFHRRLLAHLGSAAPPARRDMS